MAQPGVKWAATNEEILEHLKAAHGRATYAARSLNVKYDTFYKRLKEEPELQKALSEIRNQAQELFLDEAENVVLSAMKKSETDMGNALKAAFFTLNSKGRPRNWTNTQIDQNQKVVFEVNYPNDNNNPVSISPKTIPTQDSPSTE